MSCSTIKHQICRSQFVNWESSERVLRSGEEHSPTYSCKIMTYKLLKSLVHI